MRSLFFFTILISFCNACYGQFLTAYLDTRKYFYVFENGFPHQLETAPVLKYFATGNMVVYVNNANEIRAWFNGEKSELGEGFNATISAVGNSVYYTRDNALMAIDKGTVIPLSYFLGDVKAGDNIIAFKDSRVDLLKVFYKGAIEELEYTLVNKMGIYDVGDNTVAYVNGSHIFKVFCEGETFELSTWEPDQFVCGRDLVAFVDGSTKELDLFVRNKIIKLENFPPQSMQMGDAIFAYVSDENAFKLFTNGKLLKLEAFAPDFYKVKDNILLFYFQNKLQVLLNGTRYELETFMPRSYQISNNNMAYVDNNGRLKFFDGGKTTVVTTETIESYELNGDVLKFYVAENNPKVFWKNKIY